VIRIRMRPKTFYSRKEEAPSPSSNTQSGHTGNKLLNKMVRANYNCSE